MRKRLEQLDAAADKGDIRAFSRADLEFHDTMVRLSRNRRIHSVFTRHVPLLKTLIPLDEHLYSSMGDSAAEHLPLLEAIEAGDPDLASARFMGHVDLARDRVAEYIETHPDIW
jgi:DNA-binding GntR family transcriptional regulator